MNDWKKQFNQIIDNAAARATRVARELSMRGAAVELYIWHKPAINGNWGDLTVAQDAPSGDWKLTNGEPLRGNVPYSHYRQWIADRVTRTPIIGA